MSVATRTFPTIKKVTVTFSNGMPSVDQDPIEVNRTNSESIQWVASPANLQFSVCFPTESPFSRRHYHEHRPASGPVKAGAIGRYKYTIEVDGVLLDPAVIIRS